MKYLRIVIGFIFVLTSGMSYATCTGQSGSIDIDFGTLTVPVNSPNSSGILYEKTGDSFHNISKDVNLSCTKPFTLIGTVNQPVPTDNSLEQVILTDGQWSGLGMKFILEDNDNEYGFGFLSPPSSNTINSDNFCSSQNCNDSGLTQVHTHLEVYGGNAPVVPGNVSVSFSNIFTVDGTTVFNYHVTGKIVAGSCTVNSSTPTTVDLGTVSTGRLPDIGSTSNQTDFSINLDCNAGVNVNLTMSGTEDPDAIGAGVLSLSNSSQGNPSANGLGIQLLYNNSPVTLNQAFSTGTASSGSYEIPFVAQYYKTKNTLGAGDVNALVTYTLTYM